jgi:2-polyprenyl-6-methoxyphenol hydroxylase-like FAD-dependent oxidoreductase
MTRGVAAVIGGSIAGLLAARAASAHFEQVLLFERDDLSDVEARKGTPQAHHVHVLLAAGSAVLQRFFPDFFDGIAARGGRYVDMSQHNNWFHFGVWKRRFECGIRAHAQSRSLLESELRRRVLELPNVRLRRASVDGVTWSTSAPQLCIGEQRLQVDFLVDAAGRGSKLPLWLEKAGFAAPRDESVVVDVTYTSARYEFTDQRDWMGVLLYPEPPDGKRAAAVLPTETGEVIVSLFGWCGERAGPTDEEFLAFAESLPQPEVAWFLARAKRVSEFRQYHYREARLRHYGKLERLPPATIALGDALCSVDPVFGQGMTVAALSAEVLERCLAESVTDPAREYWSRVAAAYRTAWQLSTGEDLRYPEVIGRRPFGTALSHWYTGHVHRLTALDDDVYRRFARVMHLLEPPTHLFHPSVLGKVLSSALRGRGAAAKPRPRG